MKKIMRALTIIMCVFLLTTSVFASDVVPGASARSYLRFIDNDSRIYANGDFDFFFSYKVISDHFYPTHSYIIISTTARVYCAATGETTPESSTDYQYCVRLYEKGFFDTVVGSYYGLSDGTQYSGYFIVTEGAEYYFDIVPVDDYLWITSYSITGTGHVTNISLNAP